MLNAGIIGATGYTGQELVTILSSHRKVKLALLQALVDKEESISDIFPHLKQKTDLICKKPDKKAIVDKCDIVFLALPHTISMRFVPELLGSKKKVIDLSADYRLELAEYEKWYNVKHIDPGNITRAVYGLPELYRNIIKEAEFVANPGCYPTAAILGIAPAVKSRIIKTDTIIIDAKSGTSGAGRKASLGLSFTEVNENTKAYRINQHQHKPEINMVLSRILHSRVNVVFVPHLLPLNRGILSTIYMELVKDLSRKDIFNIYREFYKSEPFVQIMDEGVMPSLHDVQHTNLCSIGISSDRKSLIVISCIDNLLKGAAGQAVQNMNIMCGFDEKEALL